MKVQDIVTGTTASYFNPLYNSAAAITDTNALDVCAPSATQARMVEDLDGGVPGVATPALRRKNTGCAPDSTTHCFNDSRFRVEVDWEDFRGNTGAGEVVPFSTDDSGLFWFFGANNWEMLVKVLDGCSINDHFWVFSAATTNVKYTLKVTDTETGKVKEYSNPLATAAPAITDDRAFATCLDQ